METNSDNSTSVRPGQSYAIDLFVPDPQEVQDSYFRQKQVQPDVPFPHWTKLWPAALAMGDFIHHHPEWVQDQNVLELAAGLGLPSLVAACFAKAVCCSNYLEESVATMARSAQYLQLSNVTCEMLDWNHLPDDLSADVLLLSDINYDPDQFTALYEVLQRFLQQGALILLTTPQRLMAKPFIEKLLPFCRQQYEMPVEDDAQNGPDHVDAHRSPAYVAGGYVKRHFVDHTMYTTSSMIHTIELILGMPPMTQYDAAATPMWRCFSQQPDVTVYNTLPAQVNLKDVNPAGTKLAEGGSLDFENGGRGNSYNNLLVNCAFGLTIMGANGSVPAADPVIGGIYRSAYCRNLRVV